MAAPLRIRRGRPCRGRCKRLANPFAQLAAALFRESNPAPLKYALSLIGLMSPKVRLPLVELTDQTKAELADMLNLVCDGYSHFMIGKICVPPRTGPLAAPIVRARL